MAFATAMLSRGSMPLALLIALLGVGVLVGPQYAAAAECEGGRGINKLGQCDLCPVGTYSRGGENVKCTACPDGTTSPLGSNSKFDCDKCKQMTAGRFGKCKPCPLGTYVNEYGQLNCKKCSKLVGVGHLSTFGCRWYAVCQPRKLSFFKQCPIGSCWLDKKQCCVDSKDGKTCVEKLSDQCPAGYGIEKSICDKCPFRYYRPSPKSPPRCKPCPRGTTGTSDRISCSPCRSGQYNPNMGGTCESCPNGQYSIQTRKSVGPAACRICPTRKLFREPLKECWQYVVCKPGARMRTGVCTVFECFNEAKQCCENVKTKKCVSFP